LCVSVRAKGFRWGQLRLNNWNGRGKKAVRVRVISACWCQNNKLFYNAWNRQRTHNHTLKHSKTTSKWKWTHTEAIWAWSAYGQWYLGAETESARAYCSHCLSFYNLPVKCHDKGIASFLLKL